MVKQMMIVAMTMCLYNFIRENYAQDKDFHRYHRNPIMGPLYLQDIETHHVPEAARGTSDLESNDRTMDKF